MFKFISLVLLLTSCGQLDVKDTLNSVLKSGGPLTKTEMSAGLKQALMKGLDKSVSSLSQTNGYLGDSALKIPLPEEAKIIKSTLSKLGMNSLVEKTEVSLNRAAEDAAQLAKPIFLSAITKLSFKDVVKIVKGNGTEATDFLKSATTKDLTKAFSPKIADSLNKVSATKYWGEMVSKYNQIPFIKKINPNINSYVTSLAIKGLFSKIAVEEKSIRDHPKARTTELLQKVFSKSRP